LESILSKKKSDIDSMLKVINAFLLVVCFVCGSAVADSSEKADRELSFARYKAILKAALVEKSFEKYSLCFPPEFQVAIGKNKDTVVEFLKTATVIEDLKIANEITTADVIAFFGESRFSAIKEVLMDKETVKFFKLTCILPKNGSMEDVVVFRNGVFYKLAN